MFFTFHGQRTPSTAVRARQLAPTTQQGNTTPGSALACLAAAQDSRSLTTPTSLDHLQQALREQQPYAPQPWERWVGDWVEVKDVPGGELTAVQRPPPPLFVPALPLPGASSRDACCRFLLFCFEI